MSVRLGAWLLTLLLGSPTFALEPLECPEGTTLKRVENKQKGVNEICVNAAGRRQGPERSLRGDGTLISEGVSDASTGRSVGKVYDEQGELTAEVTLQNGKFVSWRLTRLGIQNLFDSMNDDFEKAGRPASVRVIDERTVGLDYHFTDADPVAGALRLATFERYLKVDCQKMFSKLEQLEVVKVRVVNGRDENPAMETTLRREECGPQDPE